MKPKQRLLVLGFRVAWWLLPKLPEAPANAVFNIVADVVWLFNGKGVRQLQANLAAVVARPVDDDAVRALARRGMRSYLRYWRELFSLTAWDKAEIDRRVQVSGLAHLDAALAAGKGVILVGPHAGSWDLAGSWLAQHYGTVTTVAEALEPRALFEMFTATRIAYGLEVLPHRGGPQPAFAVLMQRLRAGGIIGLVSDRDLSDRGVPVQFFGQSVGMPAGPATMALRTGASILPVYLHNESTQVIGEINPPLQVDEGDDVALVTQRMADVFARDIARHPADWHMLQPLTRGQVRSA